MSITKEPLLEKRSLFDAWITDCFSVQTVNGAGFEVISLEEVKARIGKLIEEEKFSEVTTTTKKIRDPVSFSESKRSKSMRVPLSVYLKLVEIALLNKISLNQVILDYIFRLSEAIIRKLEKKDKINKEKITLLKESRLTLKKKDYFREDKGLIASLLPPFIPNHYKIKIRKTPEKWKNITQQLTDETIEKYLSEHQKKIPREVLERFLELAINESLFLQNLSELEPFPVVLGDDGKISSTITWTGLEIEGNNEYEQIISHEYGYKTARALMEHLGPWIYSDGDIWSEGNYDNIFHVSFRLNDDGSLFLNEINVNKIEDWIDAELSIKHQEQMEKLKKDMTEALQNGNFQKVEEISSATTRIHRKNDWTIFFLGLLLKLKKGKSQVISFPAPDCIIALWEAYGDIEFSGIFTFEME